MSSKSSSSFSVVEFDDDDTAGVDAWESTGILSAAEAYQAEKDTEETKLKLDEEEKKCTDLAESAKKHIEEMASLLKKVELTTATKEEMKRLSMLDEEMKRLKVSITESKSAIKSYNEETVKSLSKSKTYALMKASKEREIESVTRFISEAETVDLAFLLDCTGSMSPYIESAKSSIKEVVRRVKRTNDGLKLRVAVVGYRDLYNRDKRFEILDFTESVVEFETFVSNLKPISNKDLPEDIAGAIQKARALNWQQVSRVTFLIADYPCHGERYHNIERDEYPAGTPGICIEYEIKGLKGQGVGAEMQLHFGRITQHTNKMIRVFDESGIKFEVCDLKDPKKLSSAVTSSVRKSISKSVTASMSDRSGFIDSFEEVKAIKEYFICEAKPSIDEWNAIKPGAVNVLCNKPVNSVEDLKAPLSFGLIRYKTPSSAATEEKTMTMRRAKHPFAEGELRVAYYAKMGRENSGTLTEASVGDKILKSFKKLRKSSSDKKHYLAQMEVSTIAQYLAEEYNKTGRPSHCPKISFLSVYVVETEGPTAVERYCAEDQLPGAATGFTKYSNNTGYWNEDEINQSLLLFTRFSHEKTGGYLMVTDLQGVRNGNEYILTDPAILCKDKTRFGDTNLGGRLMDKCMKATAAMLEEYGWEDV